MTRTKIVEDAKLQKLKKILLDMKRIVVAYSGGVDSTFLLYMAKSTLSRKNVLAVTALSESYPEAEKEKACEIAKSISVDHIIIKSEELSNENFRKNPIDRCYYCKKELFSKLNSIAKNGGYNFVVDGSTLDDLKDLRYGTKAAKEENVRSPLQEAKLNKEKIRGLSKKMGVETWDKPSFACLASRFAYGQEITAAKLKSIEQAEEFIKGLGFRQLRVRCHNDIARIEVAKCDIERLLRRDLRESIVKKLRSLGFVYIALDLMGYRTGSMNEGLDTTRLT